MNIKYKERTDEEIYEELKLANKLLPDLYMDAEVWKQERLIELKRLGLNWSE